MALVWVRHLEPAVAPGICYGRLDLALSEPAQASLAEFAAQLLGRLGPLAAVVSSPAQRCRQLAACLSPAVETDPRLAELDFGAWEGLSWNAVPRSELDAWAEDLVGYRPGGGESLRLLAQRVEAWRGEVRQRFDLTRETVLAISHGGPIRVAMVAARAWPLERASSCSVPFGGCVEDSLAALEPEPLS